MSQESYEECLEQQLADLNREFNHRLDCCVDYLKIISMYSKMINECDNIEDAKEWARRMIDHALEVK